MDEETEEDISNPPYFNINEIKLPPDSGEEMTKMKNKTNIVYNDTESMDDNGERKQVNNEGTSELNGIENTSQQSRDCDGAVGRGEDCSVNDKGTSSETEIVEDITIPIELPTRANTTGKNSSTENEEISVLSVDNKSLTRPSQRVVSVNSSPFTSGSASSDDRNVSKQMHHNNPAVIVCGQRLNSDNLTRSEDDGQSIDMTANEQLEKNSTSEGMYMCVCVCVLIVEIPK